MAFTVLDPDAPQADANAYISVAEFTDFHTDRNVQQVVDGEFEPAQVQAAIINATDYIEKRFGRKFRGFKRSRQQRLEWPRIDAFDNDDYTFPGRPEQLLAATAEYALLSLQLGRNLAPPVAPGFGVVDPKTGESVSQATGALVGLKEKVGPIETDERYADASKATNKPMTSSGSAMTQSLPEYPQADLWLEELLKNRTSRRIVRG